MAEILTYCEEFLPGDPPEFFFDRNPETFPGILDMFRFQPSDRTLNIGGFRTGQFHIPDGGRGENASCSSIV